MYLCAVRNSARIKKFEIPSYYRSSITGKIKEARRKQDLRKQDFSPAILDFGPVQFILARHFGFCYGVENAIEISYRAIEENPNRKIYLLSQMIHNQEVNADLLGRGVEFIMDTDGTQLIPWDNLTSEDIVIVPAFGTTLEIEALLLEKGVEVQRYNTTCPFVEKVWNRAEKLGKESYTTIIHGKPRHEETRATFSHSASHGASVIVSDMEEAIRLGAYITGERAPGEFYSEFAGKFSEGLRAETDFQRIGVVNQTTMLATETQAIADYFRTLMLTRYGASEIRNHFADTRDTLCYATNDNQDSTYQLLALDADLAIVVGGYNSSNTSHIVELCERKFPTYFINSEREIHEDGSIDHFDIHRKVKITTGQFLPQRLTPPATGAQTDTFHHLMPHPEGQPVKIVLTSGASCPDTIVDRVLQRVLDFFPDAADIDTILAPFNKAS